MGFNKRYVTKESLLEAIKRGREHYENYITKPDALILDKWSSYFLEDLSKEHLVKRKDIIERSSYSSSYPDATLLTSLSECLIDLYDKEASWIDIGYVISKLHLNIPENMKGKFQKLRTLAINEVIKYYDSKVRESNLNNLDV